MEKILSMLMDEQDAALQRDLSADVTIQLATGEQVTGILETAHDNIVSIRRLTEDGCSYADIPRHYAIGAVVGAFYTVGS